MKNLTLRRTVLVASFLSVIFTSVAVGQIRTARPSVFQTRNLVIRLESKTDLFRRYAQSSLDRSPINNTNREDRIMDFITDFENATDALRRNSDARLNVDADVREVLNRALFIDRFMARNRLSLQANNMWASIRTDLNSLARMYNVSWNWTRIPQYPGSDIPSGRGFDARLSGTYRLNHSQSDDINVILDRADDLYDATQRDRMRDTLERRLTSPELLVLQKNGRVVTLASSLSPQVVFDADGVPKTEVTRNGRTIRTTASMNNDGLLVAYEGDRASDFYLTFTPTREGQLRVTRRLYLEDRNETISVTSVYDKTSTIPDWSAVNVQPGLPANTGTTSRDFYIPNGTQLTARLTNMVTTQTTQSDDRFAMEVVSPNAYRGAILEGRVANAERSGRVSGRASLSFEFDTIRAPNGNTYRFGGIIDSVRAANGDDVRVSNEGTIRDSNRTTTTATRAGIGAALGALIGAIAGGGQGAAVGAVVGAGAGAGTVFIQGRDDIELAAGTEFNITATSPANTGVRPY